ncbi:hypothetical protein TDB9533_01703 [Thalassocella blandensis]|nr:hypothetical protein TDB9533_01703 [Thalassocella blandensis]
MVNNSIKTKISASDIKAAFQGNFTQPEVSMTFIWKAYLNTALVLLPAAVYSLLLCIFAIKFLIFVVMDMPLFVEDAGGFYTLAYLAGVILGGSAIAFFARPYFPSKKAKSEIILRNGKEGALFLLVNSLAKKLGSPGVAKIKLNMDVVVQAYFQNHREFKQNELTLELGMPVLMCMKSDEIASLVAHELGHYSHPLLRPAFALKRFVRCRMFEVMNGEEGWQEKVDALQDRISLLGPLCAPIELGIKLVNSIVQFAYDVTGDLTEENDREIEYMADLHQAAILGSEGFSDMLHNLIRTDQAYHAALEKIHLGEIFPDDLSRFVQNMFAKTQAQKNQYIELSATDNYSNWYMHPVPTVRNNAIKKARVNAQYHLPHTFNEILPNLQKYSKALSKSYYQVQEIEIDRSKIVRMEEGQVAVRENPVRKLLNDFSNQLFSDDIVWDVSESKKFAQLGTDKLIAVLNKLAVNIRHNIPEYSSYRAQAEKQFQRQAQMHFGNWLIKDGSRKRPSQEQMEKLRREADDFTAVHQASLESYKKYFGSRVAAAVALDKTGKSYATGSKLLSMLRALQKLEDKFADSQIKASTVEKLIERRQDGDGKLHRQTIARLARMLLKNINEMETVLAAFPQALLGTKSSSVMANKLNIKNLNGEEFEQNVLLRAKELEGFYGQFNAAVSVQLAKIASQNEARFKVRPVNTMKMTAVGSRAA